MGWLRLPMRRERGVEQRVQLAGPPEQLDAMFRQVAEQWRVLGESEPHWSVLTEERFRLRNIGANDEAEFYFGGGMELVRIDDVFTRHGCDPHALTRVLELGCGIGRVTLALATRFSHVLALDVSMPHLKRARAKIAAAGHSNVEFMYLESMARLDRLPSVDLFHSVLVLQHNPPPVIARLLDRCLAAVRPGGFALFQVPVSGERYAFDWDSYLKRPRTGMEMHVLPQAHVAEILARHAMETIEIAEDASTGSAKFISKLFFARKAVQAEPRAAMSDV